MQELLTIFNINSGILDSSIDYKSFSYSGISFTFILTLFKLFYYKDSISFISEKVLYLLKISLVSFVVL